MENRFNLSSPPQRPTCATGAAAGLSIYSRHLVRAEWALFARMLPSAFRKVTTIYAEHVPCPGYQRT